MWRVRFQNRTSWRFGLTTWLSHEFQSRGNWTASLYFLSCSGLAGMTLQLLACLAPVQLLAACKLPATCEIQSRVPVSLHNLEHFFTLSHTLPSHDSHLNIGLLIAKIQANLTRNKANKMVDTIQPYKSYWIRFGVRLGCYVINFTICILCRRPYFLCHMALLSLQQSVTK